MAQKKFTQLTAGATPDGSEIMAAVQSGSSVRLTLQQVFTGLVGTVLSFKGNHDISTNLFAANAKRGYVYYTGATSSMTLEGQNGTGPISKGTLLISNVAGSGNASTTDAADWIIIPTQY